MKRSEVNASLRTAIDALKRYGISLPSFADRPPEAWQFLGPEHRRIVLSGLGWDVTDLGRGNFDELGGVLFTLRNGNPAHPGAGTPYAER